MAEEGVEFRTGVEIGIDLPVGRPAAPVRRDRALLRDALGARSSGSRPRACRRSLRGRVSDAAESPAGRGSRVARRRHHRRGQARRDHRRRRYRRRLPRHGPPPGCAVGAPVRAAGAAARRAARRQSVAAVAERLPDLVGPRGGRRARLRRVDRAVPRRSAGPRSAHCRRSRSRSAARAGGCRSRASPGTEFELEADLVLLAMGFVGPERGSLLSELGVKLTDRGNVWRDDAWMTASPASSPPATCSGGSRSSCGRSPMAGTPRIRSMHFLMGKTA